MQACISLILGLLLFGGEPTVSASEANDEAEKPAIHFQVDKVEDAKVTALLNKVKDYLESFKRGNYSSMYYSHSKAYQEKQSLEQFLQQRRANLVSYQIKDVNFLSAECVDVSIETKLSTAQMNLPSVPLYHEWFWNGESWEIFEQPQSIKSAFLGRRRKGQSLVSPCEAVRKALNVEEKVEQQN